MSTPEPTPQEKALKRVLKISWLDGWSVVVIAALSLLITLALGELFGIAVSLLVLAAGIIELRGRRALKRRNAGGMKLLVRSQVFLLTVILVYCARSLGSFDSESMMANLTPDMETILKESGIDRADVVPLVHKMFLLIYGSLALISLFYQGGLALFYRRRTPLVTEALAAPLVRVSVLPPSI